MLQGIISDNLHITLTQASYVVGDGWLVVGGGGSLVVGGWWVGSV